MRLFGRLAIILGLLVSPLASSEAAVKTFLPKHLIGAIDDSPTAFAPTGDLPMAQIDALASFIRANGAKLRAFGPITLRLASQSLEGSDRFVRFQQVVRLKVGNRETLIPLDGASVVAVIRNSRLVSLNTSLVAQSNLGITSGTTGLRFAFSDAEMARLVRHLKTNTVARAKADEMFQGIARRQNRRFDFNAFLNRELVEQKVSMNEFFGNLGAMGTARLLVEMAMNNQVSFVRYGDQWAMQLTGLFDLPLQFDVMSPPRFTGYLLVKNLREVRTHASEIRGFESPFFPGGRKTEGGEHGTRAADKLKSIAQYFSDRFGWTSFKGKGVDAPIEIHTQLKSIDYRENASWIGSLQKFIVGEGGTQLAHIDDSTSVLGHEYAHAIVQFSSGLAYRGQSGAINEHFADIQGATIDATLNNAGKFRFTIGEEILTPAVKDEKAKLLDLIMSNKSYTQDEIAKFGLRQVGLRHLYAPALSFATQIDSLSELRKVYPDTCQPSIDNDNCGVHSASGIPNKAASLIIDALGLDATRTLFFNTIVRRLNPSSDFRDYLVQLIEECQATPAIANRCAVITMSFAKVGVNYPKPGELEAPVVIAVSGGSATNASLVPVTKTAATPPLKLCGWVDKVNEDRIRIYDEKYNGTIVFRNYDVKTQGDVSKLSSSECACVTGRLTQVTNARSQMINAFLEVTEVEDRGLACNLDARLRANRPPAQPDRMDTQLDPNDPHYFCGWVSVNSRSRNVTIIDNKYDVALLASGYPTLTQGDYSEIYANQCACAYGKIAQTTNEKGTVFNYLSNVEGRRVVPKDPELCSVIEWK